MAHESYTIGRAARAAGVGVETIRFYERKGLIEQPLKPAQGARRYPKATVDRIRALRQGQELGFSLAEIDGLLALRADPTADCGDVRQRAQAHLEDVERKQARLGEVADKLRELIAACPGRGATHACAILDTFSLPDSETDGITTHPAAAAGTPAELCVQGMACGGCAASVRALLCDLPGVHDAAVDRVTGIARLRVEASVTTPAMLAARLTESGFPATPR
jgi:DNA-binding transcriptional MerR regulator/copper chaperone CopZ